MGATSIPPRDTDSCATAHFLGGERRRRECWRRAIRCRSGGQIEFHDPLSVDTCPGYSLRRTSPTDVEHSVKVAQIGGRTIPADVDNIVEVEQIVDSTILADVEQSVIGMTVPHAKLFISLASKHLVPERERWKDA